MFACLHNEELHSLGSALGMLYEYVLKKSDANNSSREPFGADTLPLALSQCDRAIEGLKVQTLDPGTALIACVLLIFFEALQGRTNEALIHCMQGRNLLKNLYEDRTRRFINPEIARPAIEGLLPYQNPGRKVMLMTILGLELQARCVPGVRTSETPLEAFRVLRLPECTRLYNLDQAHQTLHAAYLSLLTASKSFKAGLDTYEVVMAMAERQNRFSPWLDKWEQLFDEFLSQGVCDPDNRKTNILKVNLLTMKILANIDLTRRGSAWNPFVSHFRSITDLSASVLQVCGLGTATTLSTIRFPFMNFGLWVAESLFFTMARCPNYEIRWQAGQLLLAQPYRSKTARSRHSPQPQSAFPLPGDKTDSWTVEDWITFTDAAPIDHGLAVFFGGFQRTSDLIRYHH